MSKLLRRSICKSYLVGLPLGIITIGLVLLAPILLTGEGLLSIVVIANYGLATLGMFFTFLFALGFGGWLSYERIKAGKSNIRVSFEYSLLINFLIWTVFNLIVLISKGSFLMILPAFFAFFICTFLTTYSIGLVYIKSIRKY